MRIILQNNFVHALQSSDKKSELLFYPLVRSDIQRSFFEKRFDEIQKSYNISWPKEKPNLSSSDKVYAWDTYDSKKEFGDCLVSTQNRLFEDIDFEVPDSFSGFRRIAEEALPEYYQNAIAPYDKDVVRELDYYFTDKKLAATYFETRNLMVGRDFSTKLSAFLSCGALDVRHLFNRVKNFEKESGASKSTYWIVFELLWREFFYWHYQKHTTLFFSANGLNGEKDFSDFPKYEFADLRKLTGNEFFHCALNELECTGFQSNRTRQMFASFWLNELALNWRSGADLFERYLIDYDVYSNWGNWMYLAGVGVNHRGKPHFFIPKQLELYDPKGEYIKKWS